MRKVGVFARAGSRWPKLYAKRQTIERWFSSLKRSRLLNEHHYRIRSKVVLHAALSVLMYSATVLARLLAGDYTNMRQMRITMPTIGAFSLPSSAVGLTMGA